MSASSPHKRLRDLWEGMVLTSTLPCNDRENSRTQFDMAMRQLEEQYQTAVEALRYVWNQPDGWRPANDAEEAEFDGWVDIIEKLLGVSTPARSLNPGEAMDAGGYCGKHGLFTGRVCPECAPAKRPE